MLTIDYASYGTAFGHGQEALAKAAQAGAEQRLRPALATRTRCATGAALRLIGQRLRVAPA
jgi:hypothetical protein